MSDELRAARERLRGGDYPDAEDTPMGFYVSPTQQNDMHVVIENDLATHLSDDGEPITEAAWKSLGGRVVAPGEWRLGFTTFRGDYRLERTGGEKQFSWWLVEVEGFHVTKMACPSQPDTLGELRDLLAALKVEGKSNGK